MATATRSPEGAADLDVRRLCGSLGAEIRGLSLADADSDDAARIEALLMEHMVLFFPEQHLSVESHLAFARHFGELEGHPNLVNTSAEHPELFELRASSGAGAVADEWHSDLTCQEEPSLFAILNMVKCPPFGGDTLWANSAAAFEALSPAMRDFLEGLTALHDAHGHAKPEQTAVHPVVRVHPVTGRKSLFVNEHFTRRLVELNHQESDALLRFLTSWVHQPRFTVRYHWAPGTLAIWDNRTTQHHVLNDFEGERVIQRCTVMGDRPEASSPPRYEPEIGPISAGSRHDRQLAHHLNAKKSGA